MRRTSRREARRRRQSIVATVQWLAIAAGALALLLGTDAGRWVLFTIWSYGGQ